MLDLYIPKYTAQYPTVAKKILPYCHSKHRALDYTVCKDDTCDLKYCGFKTPHIIME